MNPPPEEKRDFLSEISELRQIRKALCDKGKGEESWMQIFRFLTPLFLFILTFYINSVKDGIGLLSTDLKDMRISVNSHLQNSELHIPRATIVSRDEFIIYQNMRDKQMQDIKDGISRIESSVRTRK